MISADFQKVSVDISSILGVEVCHIDSAVAKYGLKNTMWVVGCQFLELITPLRGDTAGQRFLDRRAGDSGYVLCTQVGDLEAVRQRVAEAGLRIVNDISGTGTGHEGIQFHPADTGGCFWEVDHIYAEGGDSIDGPWPPGGGEWGCFVNTSRVSRIKSVVLQVSEVDSTAELWGNVLDLPVKQDRKGKPEIETDNGTLKFVGDEDGRGPGLAGLELGVIDVEAIRGDAETRGCLVSENELLIGGMRIYLTPE